MDAGAPRLLGRRLLLPVRDSSDGALERVQFQLVLLVVVERWWGPDRDKSIREAYWCRSVAGKTDRVLAWMRKQTVDS